MAESRSRRLVVLLAAVLAVAVTASLGRWQLSRADQKLQLQAGIESQRERAPVELATLGQERAADVAAMHRPVLAQGRWLDQHTVYLENRQMDGRPGFFVVTPLALTQDAGVVLVQRGWLPRDPLDRTRVQDLPAPASEVLVHGRIAPPPARLYAFEGPDDGRIRQNIVLDSYSRETGLPLWPVSVLQTQADEPAAPNDPLLRAWPAPSVDVHKHYGYAAQWFGLATLITVLYVWFQLIRPRRHAGAADGPDHA